MMNEELIISGRHNHLIDPKRKRSQQRFASITLVGQLPNSDLDAYATAASVMPVDEAIAFLKERRIGYILITTDKDVLVSETLEQSVDNLKMEPF